MCLPDHAPDGATWRHPRPATEERMLNFPIVAFSSTFLSDRSEWRGLLQHDGIRGIRGIRGIHGIRGIRGQANNPGRSRRYDTPGL